MFALGVSMVSHATWFRGTAYDVLADERWSRVNLWTDLVVAAIERCAMFRVRVF